MSESQPVAVLIVRNDPSAANVLTVGDSGVTSIELFAMPGPQGKVPYARVMRGDRLHAEFCLHQCVGVFYAVDQAELDALIVGDLEAGTAAHDAAQARIDARQ